MAQGGWATRVRTLTAVFHVYVLWGTPVVSPLYPSCMQLTVIFCERAFSQNSRTMRWCDLKFKVCPQRKEANAACKSSSIIEYVHSSHHYCIRKDIFWPPNFLGWSKSCVQFDYSCIKMSNIPRLHQISRTQNHSFNRPGLVFNSSNSHPALWYAAEVLVIEDISFSMLFIVILLSAKRYSNQRKLNIHKWRIWHYPSMGH